LGDRVVGVGDVDLDGVPDVAARLAKVFDNKSEVHLISGATGATLLVLQPVSQTHAFGLSLATAGDLTGDGIADVLVGTPGAAVAVYSGSNGAKPISLLSPDPIGFGAAIALGGDVDGGGKPDILVGCPGASPGGSVIVYSSETTLILAQAFGTDPGGALGTSVTGGFDVNGDGRIDLAAGAPDALSTGAVELFDAATGVLLARLGGTHTQQHFGAGVVMPTDLDADGLGDVVVASSPVDSLGKSSLLAFSHLELPGPPQLAGSGDLVPDELVTVTVSGARPNAPGFLVLGGALVDLPFAGGTLGPSPDVLLPLVTDVTGTASVGARWPEALPLWTSIWMQAWIADPAGPKGFTATDAIAASQL
jgi:hypothetical protein